MTQGKFSKEEATCTITAMEEVMKAFPKNKAVNFIGHFNDIFLFLEAAKKEAPLEKDEKNG